MAPEMVMYACMGLVHLKHTGLTHRWDSVSNGSILSEILCRLRQQALRPHVNWNVECANIYKDSSFHVDSVDVGSHSTLKQSTWNHIRCWLSWQGMRLKVHWVIAVWKFFLNMSENSKLNSKILKRLILWPLKVWSEQKNRMKKSHESASFEEQLIHIFFFSDFFIKGLRIILSISIQTLYEFGLQRRVHAPRIVSYGESLLPTV
jgi:hypothetical protein